jgi:hypothetical protein
LEGRPVRARDGFADEVGKGTPLPLGELPQATVHLVVEIELGSDHTMYIHRVGV